jgi:hypothetical protein
MLEVVDCKVTEERRCHGAKWMACGVAFLITGPCFLESQTTSVTTCIDHISLSVLLLVQLEPGAGT